jgi:hypothetical protein
MSLLSDLLEGHTSNLATDITHAPSSFIQDLPSEAPYLAGAAALAAPFVLPELIPALAGGDLLAGGGAAAGTDLAAGGLDAATAAFGPFDPAAFAAESGDVAAGVGTAETAAGTLDPTAALFAGGDPAAALVDPTAALAADPAAFAADPAALALGGGDPAAFAPTEVLGGGGGGVGDIFTGSDAFAPGTFDTGLPQDASALSAPSIDTSQLAATTVPEGAAPASESTGIANLAETSIPASATSGAAAGGASSSLVPGVSNFQLAALGLGAAPLALTLAKGQPQLPTSAQALQGQANALSVQGQQDLAAARAGVLNAGQTAQIAVMKQNLTNQWLQTLKSQGVMDPTKDSRWPEIAAQIDQQTTAATAQMLQQNMQTALAETGQAAGALTSIAQMQVSQDQAFTNNLVNATKSLATVAAISGGARPQVSV